MKSRLPVNDTGEGSTSALKRVMPARRIIAQMALDLR